MTIRIHKHNSNIIYKNKQYQTEHTTIYTMIQNTTKRIRQNVINEPYTRKQQTSNDIVTNVLRYIILHYVRRPWTLTYQNIESTGKVTRQLFHLLANRSCQNRL
jgi:hypothetical protein